VFGGGGIGVGSGGDSARADRAAASVSSDDLLGKFAPCRRAGFVSVGGGKCLRKEARQSFREMAAAAWKEAGIRFWILSATRNFAAQRAIWERKWREQKGLASARERALRILEWSAMPGASRHHWGTDIDIGHSNCGGDCLVDAAWTNEKGRRAYAWLERNAVRFGFCQPYRGAPASRNGGAFAKGTREERWHWSHRSTAVPIFEAYVARMKRLRPAKSAFSGAQVGAELLDAFVRNIDADCAK
jgi:hypothetical protein